MAVFTDTKLDAVPFRGVPFRPVWIANYQRKSWALASVVSWAFVIEIKRKRHSWPLNMVVISHKPKVTTLIFHLFFPPTWNPAHKKAHFLQDIPESTRQKLEASASDLEDKWGPRQQMNVVFLIIKVHLSFLAVTR